MTTGNESSPDSGGLGDPRTCAVVLSWIRGASGACVEGDTDCEVVPLRLPFAAFSQTRCHTEVVVPPKVFLVLLDDDNGQPWGLCRPVSTFRSARCGAVRMIGVDPRRRADEEIRRRKRRESERAHRLVFLIIFYTPQIQRISVYYSWYCLTVVVQSNNNARLEIDRLPHCVKAMLDVTEQAILVSESGAVFDKETFNIHISLLRCQM